MSLTAENQKISLVASDVSGQKMVNIAGVSCDSGETVGEFVRRLIPKMDLPSNDVEGRPLTYHARLEREGRHLHASEIISDVLQDEDKIVLQPVIMAGAN